MNTQSKLLYFKNIEYIQKYSPDIVIMMPVKNVSKTIEKSIVSILSQVNITKKFLIVISDDNSTDDWIIKYNFLLKNKNIVLFNNCFNSVTTNRNFLINIIKNINKNCIVFRLDGDDSLTSDNIIYRIEKKFQLQSNKKNIKLYLGGNYLFQQGVLLKKVNQASNQLLHQKYLLDQLYYMSKGISENELPSCNLVMTSELLDYYPNLKSAEDHLLLVKYLMFNKKYMYIDEELFYANYSLSGNMTNNNKKDMIYLESRERIFNFAEKVVYE